MATLSVGNTSELQTAIDTATSGDVVVLESGNYGNVTINGNFGSEVQLVAAEPGGAAFGDLEVRGSNMALDGLTVNGEFTLRNVSDVDVLNSRLADFSQVLFSEGVRFEGNDIGGGYHGLFIEESRNFEIVNNRMHDVVADMFRIMGNSHDGLVENNVFSDTAPVKHSDGTYVHSDLFQTFGRDSGTPHDLTIRGNHFYDDPATGDSSGNLWAQGIFISDPGAGGYRNIVIEENLLSVGSPNAIFVLDSAGAPGVVVRDNSLLPWPAENGATGGTIRMVGNTSQATVDGNVSGGIGNDGGASIANNFTYSKSPSDANFFGNIFSGDGDVWEDFVPVADTAIDFGSGYGALDRLNSLAESGWSSEGNGDEPEPAPAPEAEPTPEPEEPEDDTAGETLKKWEALFTADGKISSASEVMEFAPDQGLALDEGMIQFDFNAETVSGQMGLVSADAYGNGDHVTIYIDDGELIARFQNENGEVALVAPVSSNTDYAVDVSFEDETVALFLDGEVVDEAQFDASWAGHENYLQIGANGWASQPGESGYTQVFDGEIRDFAIYGSGEAAGAESADPLVFHSAGGRVEAAWDVLEVPHDESMAIEAGTIQFHFNANSISGQQGLVSRDAYGNGDHFTSYINEGELFVRFQNEDGEVALTAPVSRNTNHAVEISFGDGMVALMLDGELVDRSEFDATWVGNDNYLQIGANGWASQPGEAGFTQVFDGEITDVAIFDGQIGEYRVVEDGRSDVFFFSANAADGNEIVVSGFDEGVDMISLAQTDLDMEDLRQTVEEGDLLISSGDGQDALSIRVSDVTETLPESDFIF